MNGKKLLLKFKNKYPRTVAWRLNSHYSVIMTHIDPDEVVEYAFCGQKGNGFFDTAVIVITNKRILVAQKNIFFGYKLDIITPDMFNDMNIRAGMIWGSITIDTIKELIIFSRIDKKALDEIEDNVSTIISLK